MRVISSFNVICTEEQEHLDLHNRKDLWEDNTGLSKKLIQDSLLKLIRCVFHLSGLKNHSIIVKIQRMNRCLKENGGIGGQEVTILQRNRK